MTALVIALIVVILLGIYCIWIAHKIECKEFNYFSAVLFVCCGGIISEINNYNKPMAIDVYQGKTTLQITYQDSIPIDTAVVFKNK